MCLESSPFIIDKKEMQMNDIEIYTLPDCPFCIKAKTLLTKNGLKYNEHDISDDEEKKREELKKKFNLSERATVPQITINNKYVGGYSQLKDLFESEKIYEYLK